MSHEPLLDRIGRETADEADAIVGELARSMSAALRTRAEQVASVCAALNLPLPAPIAWVLDLDVPTVPPTPVVPTPTVAAAQQAERLERGDDARPEVDPTVDDEEHVRRVAEAQRARAAEEKRIAGVAEAVVKRPPVQVEHVVVRSKKPASQPKAAPAKPAPAQPTGEEYTTAAGVVRHKPQNPGVEAVPEHLRHLPAAAGRGPLRPRIETCELQLRVLNEVNRHRNCVSKEVADALGIKLTRSTDHLKALAEAGLIRRTGKNRLARTARSGKPGYEYAPAQPTGTTTAAPKAAPAKPAADHVGARKTRDDTVVSALRDGPLRWSALEKATGFHPNKLKSALESLGDKVVKQTDGSYALAATPDPQPAAPASAVAASEPEPVAAPAATSVELDIKGAELLSKHSAFAATMRGKGPFPPSAAAEAIGVPSEVSQAMLSLLTEQTRGAVVNDVGVPGAPLFEYNEIKGPGAAAERDAERSRERSRAEAHAGGNGTAGGAPVAGTAWDAKHFSSDKEVQRRLRMAHNKGWPIEKRGGGHIMIHTPMGPVTVGSTPNKSGLRDDGKRLEAHGLRGALSR